MAETVASRPETAVVVQVLVAVKAASPVPVLVPGPFQGAEAAASLLSGSARGLEGIRNFSGINRMYWLQSYLNRGDFKQIQLF